MPLKTGKTVKKYRQGNIPAAFGTDLWFSGATNVPNILLKCYKHINISDTEMMLLIQMFRLRLEEKDLRPSPEDLAEYMLSSPGEIEKQIESLYDKKIIVDNLYYNESKDEIINGYDFEPLFEKLTDCWACIKAKEIEKVGSKLDGKVHAGKNEDNRARCYDIFEKEFGRPLSPIEIEKITQWTEQSNPDLVLEALRRAVLMGKRNFRYIDTILLEWKKNNLNSIIAVEEYENGYQNNKKAAGNNKSAYRRKPPNAVGNDSKRKALIKKLYLT